MSRSENRSEKKKNLFYVIFTSSEEQQKENELGELRRKRRKREKTHTRKQSIFVPLWIDTVTKGEQSLLFENVRLFAWVQGGVVDDQ